METEHGSFMVNDLALAFIYALSYCAQVIYNLMEGSPSRGPMFQEKRRENLPQRKEKEEKREKQNETKINGYSLLKTAAQMNCCII